jgi:hypothetical protein
MFTSSETTYEIIPEQKETKKEKNIKEWNRINNIWLDIRNKNKTENPNLYSTDSDNSAENTPDTSCIMNLKKSSSFSSYDDEISNENSIYNGIMDTRYDDADDTYYADDTCYADDTYNTYKYTHRSIVTPNSIKCKYTCENAASLELDYSLNYNMKMLTHIGNYYEILKSKYSQGQTKMTKMTKKRNVATKLCKPELIKSIVAFETDAANHSVVYQCKKMLEYIDSIKNDKYFGSFVIFP